MSSTSMLLPMVRSAEMAATPPRKRRCLRENPSDCKENMPANMQANMQRTNTDAVGPCILASKPCVNTTPLQSTNCFMSQSPQRARNQRSEVGCYPLIGRERECGELDQFLQQSLSNATGGKGNCIYISGGPGTGKTCSVRASVERWQTRLPGTRVLEVNCMGLTQRSVPGVLQHMLTTLGCARMVGRSMDYMAAAVAAKLAELASRVVIVVDEVDQLISRGSAKAASGALSLQTLFSLPQLPGAPAIAVIAIANAVDLLERSTVFSRCLNCRTLLFEAYNKDQLKSIVTSRVKAVEGGEAALKTLGPVKVELRVRQVAKECGDCRQILSLIEEALFEAAQSVQDSAAPADVAPASSATSSSDSGVEMPIARKDPKALIKSGQNDPLQAIPQLPLEQQILLMTLATSKNEANKVGEVCGRYKDLCCRLKQPNNLGSKNQIISALSALEQRGLLEMRTPKPSRGRGRAPQLSVQDTAVELSVSCDALRETVVRALPLLSKFMD